MAPVARPRRLEVSSNMNSYMQERLWKGSKKKSRDGICTTKRNLQHTEKATRKQHWVTGEVEVRNFWYS